MNEFNKNENELGIFYQNKQCYIFFGKKHFFESFQLKTPPLNFVNQVHGTDLYNFTDQSSQGDSTRTIKADGLFTKLQSVSLGLKTADCVPLFLFSESQLYALHLGWRSLAFGLLERALNQVSHHKPLRAFIGPHIQQNSFEVGQEVIDHFDKYIPENRDWLSQRNISLSRIIQYRLSKFTDVQIFDCNVCTKKNHEFYSHRRDPSSSGRNLSFAFFKNSL